MITEDKLLARATTIAIEEIGITKQELGVLDRVTNELVVDYIAEVTDDMRYNYMKYFRPLDHQKRFFNLKSNRKGLIAANRSGKTVSTCMETAYHLTGRYPSWWRGRRFKGNIVCSVAGESWQQVAQSVQSELLGTPDASDFNQLGTGSIPRECIDLYRMERDGYSAKTVHVRHKCGQDSVLYFANYSQQGKNKQGFDANLIVIDEQPPDDFYSELAMRTANTDGLVICSFTPLKGFSKLVSDFWENKDGFEHVRVTWADIPEYDMWGEPLLLNSTRQLLIKGLQDYEIAPRTEGIPMRGTGVVFTAYPIPVYNSPDVNFTSDYHRIIAIDLASKVDKTVITVMYWHPGNKVGYIDHQYVLPAGHSSAITSWKSILLQHKYKGTPIVLPSDANQSNRYADSGQSVREILKASGLHVVEQSINAKFKVDKDSTNTINYGISQMNTRMSEGTLKIHASCTELLKEINGYHLDDKGNYRGSNDCIDSARYATLGCLLGMSKPVDYIVGKENEAFKAMAKAKALLREQSKPIWKQTRRIL